MPKRRLKVQRRRRIRCTKRKDPGNYGLKEERKWSSFNISSTATLDTNVYYFIQFKEHNYLKLICNSGIKQPFCYTESLIFCTTSLSSAIYLVTLCYYQSHFLSSLWSTSLVLLIMPAYILYSAQLGWLGWIISCLTERRVLQGTEVEIQRFLCHFVSSKLCIHSGLSFFVHWKQTKQRS